MGMRMKATEQLLTPNCSLLPPPSPSAFVYFVHFIYAFRIETVKVFPV